VGMGTACVDDVAGSGTTRGEQHHGLGEDDSVVCLGTALRAWGRRLRGRWRHQLGSGKMEARKGVLPWSGTMARALCRSMTAQAPGKILAGNFTSLIA
jgi:hypothetical protein